MTVLIVKPGEEPYPAEIGSGLSAMQEVVGGQIEAVYPFEARVALICHEEVNIPRAVEQADHAR